ncbi:peptidoglycan-associated lipoprotein Pal [Massilia sp. TSP1-1-2]|uniref:peptidoglycan-associated lipoprotein Pal n=1 Tax=unclassified Massilia TaxID=2609279 RepID=UPI003CECDA72
MIGTRNVVCLLAAAALAACSTPVKLSETAVADRPIAATAAVPGASARDVLSVQTGSTDPLNDPQGALAQRSVYFDYDSYLVRPDGRAVVGNHASYLGKNSGRRIIIQGNTDERGGTEFNVALGQKRAEAVRKSLAALGVAESQMEAVSLGENKPVATGAGEATWAKNRRADIVY